MPKTIELCGWKGGTKNNMKFDLYYNSILEEKFLSFSNTEEKDTKKIIEKYYDLFIKPKWDIRKLGKSAEEFYKNKLDPDGFLHLGKIRFYDSKTKTNKAIDVLVSFEKNSKERGSYDITYDYSTDQVNYEEIILFYYKIGLSRESVDDALTHELNHAKQGQKIPSRGYKKGGLDYWLDPIEVHNYTSNISRIMDRELNHPNADEYFEKEEILNFLKSFNEGKKPDKIPNMLKGKEEFLNAIFSAKDIPKYRKEYLKFFKKMQWYYNEYLKKSK